MTVTVFVWDMWGKGPDGARGVGHASMHVSGAHGSIYVSFWPKAHSPSAGWSSPGRVHFMNADRMSDGHPSWASKPLTGLNEKAIIEWWSKIQRDPLIDYKHKKPFQATNDLKQAAPFAQNTQYRILNNQCSTIVVDGLRAGAGPELRKEIDHWLGHHGINIGAGIEIPLFRRATGTISPDDVKKLVIRIWHDSDYRPSLMDRLASSLP